LNNYGYVPNFVDKNGGAAYTKVSDDPEHAWKKQLLGAKAESMTEHKLWDQLDSKSNWQFFRWVSLLVFEEKDIDDNLDLKIQPKTASLGIQPISVANELKIWAFIKNLCEEILAKFPNSLEEDL
jgi:hypothetical protein